MLRVKASLTDTCPQDIEAMADVSLPYEINNFLVRQCDIEDVKSLRLVSKAFYNHATRRLFAALYVKNTDSGIHSYQNILSAPHLTEAVRQITFLTVENPEESRAQGQPQDGNTAQLSDGFTSALSSTYKFPNLASVGIHFSKPCNISDTRRYDTLSALQTRYFRADVLEALLRGLNNLEYPTPNVRSLSLHNLQDVNGITDSADFRSLLSRLTTLRLKAVSEWARDISWESPWDYTTMRRFFVELPHAWLAPCAANLTSLKLHLDLTNVRLHMDLQGGYLPKADLRGVHFPKLQALDLGKYAFGYDWQLEWILLHGATLEELTLDDCPIAHRIWDIGERDREDYALRPTNDSGHCSQWRYDRGWSHYFAEMEKRLPKLRSFRYGMGQWGCRDHFEDDILDREVEVGEEEYPDFDMTLGAASWNDGLRSTTPWFMNGCGYLVDDELARYGSPGEDFSYLDEEFENDRAAYGKLMVAVAARGLRKAMRFA
jgi:hypothetical protein